MCERVEANGEPNKSININHIRFETGSTSLNKSESVQHLSTGIRTIEYSHAYQLIPGTANRQLSTIDFLSISQLTKQKQNNNLVANK